MIEIETTIRGGLPVIVRGEIARAEPDVGIMSDSVDDYEVFWLGGTVGCRLPISDEDEYRITQDLLRAVG